MKFSASLFLTYYLKGTLGFSPVKTGLAFLPLVAALAGMAQISNRVLLPRFGPRPIVPIGFLVSAAAIFGLHLIGLHSSYDGHVLPYLLVLGLGSGLCVAPAFSTGTLGLAPQDAGVGSATLNTAQQIGGSIGYITSQHRRRRRCHVVLNRSSADPGQLSGSARP